MGNLAMFDPVTGRVKEVWNGSATVSDLFNDGWIFAPKITPETANEIRRGEELHYCGFGWMCRTEVGPRGGESSFIVKARAFLNTPHKDGTFTMSAKYGFNKWTYISDYNAHFWHRASDCPKLLLGHGKAALVQG
jgi:hypothetical protein